MKKKNVGIIGCGKYGKKIIYHLKKISNIKFIYNSKNDYKDYNKNIEWVFILTPDITHYKIAKYFLKNKVNVFCEKPLATKIKQAESLINLAQSTGTKIYIDDIEKYKKKNIKINNKINYILRIKKDIGTTESLLNRLAYHDFYLLSKYIELNKIKLISTIKKKKMINFKLTMKNNIIYDFYYNINSRIRKHQINRVRIDRYFNNPIKDMLMSLMYKKINFKNNNRDALKCIRLINLVNKWL